MVLGSKPSSINFAAAAATGSHMPPIVPSAGVGAWPSTSLPELLAHVFRVCDINGSGKISTAEIRVLGELLGAARARMTSQSRSTGPNPRTLIEEYGDDFAAHRSPFQRRFPRRYK